MDTFYLGTHKPVWLRRTEVPLLVSIRRLRTGWGTRDGQLPRRLQPATCRWALDSGGFQELALHGRWTITPERYAEEVARCAAEIGNLDWAAPQDWMCEERICAKTGSSVADHQAATIDNYCALRQLAPELPFIPVLQGRTLDDYQRHLDAYRTAGIDLLGLPRVGLGSVCRRQATGEIAAIVSHLAGLGLRLHGFGVKTSGLARYGDLLASCDSLAWAYQAWRQPRPRPTACTHPGPCSNCLPYALAWRAEVLATRLVPQQLTLL